MFKKNSKWWTCVYTTHLTTIWTHPSGGNPKRPKTFKPQEFGINQTWAKTRRNMSNISGMVAPLHFRNIRTAFLQNWRVPSTSSFQLPTSTNGCCCCWRGWWIYRCHNNTNGISLLVERYNKRKKNSRTVKTRKTR